MSYASVTQLRTYLEQVGVGTAKDAILQAILDRATDIVDGELGFSFAAWGASATARDVRGDGTQHLCPPAYKTASITGISRVYDKGETYASTDAITNYVVDEYVRPYRVWRASGWTYGGWYRVTAIWGYGPVPSAIEQVTMEVAINIWRSKDAASFGDVGAEGQGGVSVNRAMTWAQRSIIDRVRTQYLGIVHA